MSSHVTCPHMFEFLAVKPEVYIPHGSGTRLGAPSKHVISRDPHNNAMMLVWQVLTHQGENGGLFQCRVASL